MALDEEDRIHKKVGVEGWEFGWVFLCFNGDRVNRRKWLALLPFLPVRARRLLVFGFPVLPFVFARFIIVRYFEHSFAIVRQIWTSIYNMVRSFSTTITWNISHGDSMCKAMIYDMFKGSMYKKE